MIGGRSERMGRSKAGLILGGDTFLERVARAASAVFDEVVAVQRPGGEPAGVIPTIYEQPHPGSGPIHGIVRALEAVGDEPFWVLAVDYPLVTAPLLRELSAQFVESDVEAAIPLWEGLPQYLCAGYRPSIARYVTDVLEEEHPSMRGLIERCSVLEFGEDRIRRDYGDSVLANVNHPEEYETLRIAHEERS